MSARKKVCLAFIVLLITGLVIGCSTSDAPEQEYEVESEDKQEVVAEPAVSEPEERLAAVQALAEEGESAISALIDALADDSTEVVWAARDALEQIGAAAADPLIEVLEDTQNPWPVRWSAIRVLGRLDFEASPNLLPAFISALDDQQTNIVTAAASALGRLGKDAEPAIPNLVDLALNDRETTVRAQAVDALGQIGIATDDVFGAIGIAMSESDFSIAMAGNRALRAIGGESENIVPVLYRFFIEETVAEDRIMAAFGRIGSVAVAPLVSMLEAADADERFIITRILGNVVPASVPELLKLTNDQNLGVRRQAISSLGAARREADQVFPVIAEIIKDDQEDDSIRFYAVRSLLALGVDYSEEDSDLVPHVEKYSKKQPQALFVSKQGNDGWTGRYAQPTADGTDGPFATLEQARNEIRRNRALGALPEGGVTVWIGEGTYYRNDSFTLRQEDSGTEHAPIVYRAYEGEHVVFNGGQKLDPSWFTPITDDRILNRIICEDARKHVLQVDLGQYGIHNYGNLTRHGFRLGGGQPPIDLFVDAQRMTLARWPNEGYVQMGEIIDPGPKFDDPGFRSSGGAFTYTYDRPHLWSEADEIWVEGIFGYSWEWSYTKVEEIDVERRLIRLAYGEVSGLMKQWYADHHVFENLLEEIDMPGEYYLDRNTGILYLYPPNGFSSDSNIYVSMIERPMIVTDSASHVRFKDLNLSYGRNTGIDVNGGESVSIIGCRLSNFARNGIDVSGDNHKLSHSHIYDIGANGIAAHGGDWETLSGGGHLIYNNKIHANGYREKSWSPGVHLSGVGHQVINNLIFDTPHVALRVRGNDHLVEYNEFYNVAQEYSDIGAIYMGLGDRAAERGTVIRRNYFHNIGQEIHGVFGVYLDAGTMGVTVIENIFYRVGFPNGRDAAFTHNSGQNNVGRHNIFIDCRVPYVQQFNLTVNNAPRHEAQQREWERLFRQHDLASMPHSKYPGLLTLGEPENFHNFAQYGLLYPNTSIFSENVSFNPNNRLAAGQMVHFRDNQLQQGMDRNQLVIAENNHVAASDPGFVDWQNQNFRLREDAPLFDWNPDFPLIPFENMGLVEPVGPFNR